MNFIFQKCLNYFSWYFAIFSLCSTLCAKPPDRNQEMGQDLRYTFLNSSWHTDAKKIPEKLIYWRHLACFFQKTKFFWKNFFWLKLIYKVQKSFLEEKNFLWKFSKTLRKNSQLFFDAKFFPGHFSKKVFLPTTNFWTF